MKGALRLPRRPEVGAQLRASRGARQRRWRTTYLSPSRRCTAAARTVGRAARAPPRRWWRGTPQALGCRRAWSGGRSGTPAPLRRPRPGAHSGLVDAWGYGTQYVAATQLGRGHAVGRQGESIGRGRHRTSEAYAMLSCVRRATSCRSSSMTSPNVPKSATARARTLQSSTCRLLMRFIASACGMMGEREGGSEGAWEARYGKRRYGQRRRI